MDKYLDDNVQDPKLLPDTLRSLEKERDKLQCQLSGSDPGGTANEWQRVVGDVKSIVLQLETLQSNCQSLVIRLQGVDGGGVRSEARECVESVQSLVKEVVELEHMQSYLTWLRVIYQLHLQSESEISANNMLDAMDSYFQLSTLYSALEESECSHLKQFALTVKHFWNVKLKDTLSKEYSFILNKLKWPLATQSISSDALNTWDKHQQKFIDLFKALIKLDERSFPMDSAIRNLGDPIILPLQLLLDPLRKRFKYHFSGDKKTNSKEKPEWCFTQVSSWIQNHSHLLETKIQPLFNESGYSHLDARNEFIRGLLQELESKLLTDLPDVVYHDVLMSHLIDELLLFERELRTILQYPPTAPSLLHLLMDEVPFHKWLSLEKEYAVEHFKVIISEDESPSAWQPAYSGLVDADDTKVPECTEKLMAMIKGIEERYKYLSSTRHLLQFVDLQSDLLLQFHQDVVTSKESVNPLDPRYAAYLNASSYISMVLKGWGESSFFLDLYYRTLPDLDESKTPSDTAIAQLRLLRQHDKEYGKTAGTIFDTVIEAFSSLVKDMECSIVECVVGSARTSCCKYKKERWHSMPTAKDNFLVLDITPSTAELLSTLREQLVFIETRVSSFLTPELYKILADKTDQLLLSEVILGTRFSEGGAEQLYYDVVKCLVPLLSKGIDLDVQLFDRTREACRLLCLAPGSAQLLQEVLQATIKPRIIDSQFSDAVASLNEVKVHALSPSEAEQILRLRIFPAH